MALPAQSAELKLQPPTGSASGKGKEAEVDEETADGKRLLWVSPARNVGLKFRVRERKFRRDNPILILADEETAVSYDIEYEELLVRTSHLLLTFENSLLDQDNQPGRRAVVFGSFG
ncbi:F-box domain cyclin-like protein [Botryosphaeria dothidea]|uniref:F-box domain cyclin-like protein n=1 Tax=Botryosphaeria dothidea TaxID=55169 RepID=A0A8H4IUI8_9PEZI|nr:F-box domain cyclin-like protein [Botryosphaeria dothidea]